MDIRTEIRPGRSIHLSIHKNPHSEITAFLLHGAGGRGEQWREQIRMLAQHCTLIIPDLLGHGKSDKPHAGNTNPYSFSEFNQDMEVLFNQYSSQTNIILGHSYGGSLATALTLDHQDKISRLILITPVPCMPKFRVPFLYRLPAFLMEVIRPVLDRQFRQLAFIKDDNPDLIATEMKANQNNPMHVIKQVINGMQQIPHIDLSMLNTKTLMITGMSDGLVPAIVQQDFYKNLPNHEFRMIQDASHMVLLEKPEMVNQAISRFSDLL